MTKFIVTPVKMLSAVLVLILSMFLMYEWGKSGKEDAEERYERELKTWQAQRDSLLIVIKQNQRFIDSVTKDNKVLSDSITKRNIEVNRLLKKQSDMRRKNDSVLAGLKTILPDTCGPALKLAESYRREADSLLA